MGFHGSFMYQDWAGLADSLKRSVIDHNMNSEQSTVIGEECLERTNIRVR